MSVTQLFYNEQAIALNSFPAEHHKWRKCYYCMGREASYLIAHLTQDGTLDLLLRKFESELPNQNLETDQVDFAISQYLTLARYWVLSMYENIRTYREARNNKSNIWLSTDFGRRTTALYESFSLVRVPLAKLEIHGSQKRRAPKIQTIPYPPNANDAPKDYERITTSYLPVHGIDPETGSVYWDVISLEPVKQQRINRRQLSDSFLDCFALEEISQNGRDN